MALQNNNNEYGNHQNLIEENSPQNATIKIIKNLKPRIYKTTFATFKRDKNYVVEDFNYTPQAHVSSLTMLKVLAITLHTVKVQDDLTKKEFWVRKEELVNVIEEIPKSLFIEK